MNLDLDLCVKNKSSRLVDLQSVNYIDSIAFTTLEVYTADSEVRFGFPKLQGSFLTNPVDRFVPQFPSSN